MGFSSALLAACTLVCKQSCLIKSAKEGTLIDAKACTHMLDQPEYFLKGFALPDVPFRRQVSFWDNLWIDQKE